MKARQDKVPESANSASTLLPTSKAPEERTWGARTEKNAGVSSRQNSDTKKIEVTLLSQNWRVVVFMLHEPTRVAARATKRVGYAFGQMGVCQGLERRRRDDFRRADDPDGLPVVSASDLREPIIKTLERVAVSASRRCAVSTWREERAARAQTAPDDGMLVALDALTTPPRTSTTSERRARRRPAGTSRATLADRPDARPALNFFGPTGERSTEFALLGSSKTN